jgi:2,4-diaminopentanoate dehydrogenase
MPYRVVQLATGAVGKFCLQQIIGDPDLELVGLWVSDPDKDGRDAGELCDRPTTGVRATRSSGAIVALNADVVIHAAAPFGPFDDMIAELLASGKNVISTAAYFSPRIDGAAVTAKMELACAAGGSTLYGAGLDPGFVCDRVPALMTGSVTDIKHIHMVETLDVSTYAAAQLLTDIGFGKHPSELSFDNEYIQHFVNRMFPAAIGKLAEQLGLQLDAIQPIGFPELAFASRDLDIAIGHLAKGTISGACYAFGGFRDGQAIITHQWVHFAEREGVPTGWPMPPEPGPGEVMPYRVLLEIEGRPSLKVDMVYTDVEDTVFLPTATIAIRAIPEVVAAPPGVLIEPVFGAWNASSKSSASVRIT